MIGVEPLEYIATEVQTLLVQQGLSQGDELSPGDHAILVHIKNIKQLGNQFFNIHTLSLSQK